MKITDFRPISRFTSEMIHHGHSCLGYLADDCQLMSDDCVVPTLEHLLSVGCAAVLETWPLPPQDHKSGTVCRPISDYMGCHTASSGGYWRHLYSDSEATAQRELRLYGLSHGQFRRLLKTFVLRQWGHGAAWTALTVQNRNVLTYLRIVTVDCQ